MVFLLQYVGKYSPFWILKPDNPFFLGSHKKGWKKDRNLNTETTLKLKVAERERGRENEKFKGKKWRGLERRRRSKKSKAAYLSSNHVFICPCGPASMFSTTTFWMIFDQLFYLFLLFNPSRFCWLRWRFLFVLGVFIIVNCQPDVLFFLPSNSASCMSLQY